MLQDCDLLFYRTECSLTTGEGCEEHEECELKLEDEEMGYVCVCEPGYMRVSDKCELYMYIYIYLYLL